MSVPMTEQLPPQGPPHLQPFEVKPTPDPTVLTTEQLLREIDRVVKLLEAKIEGYTRTTDAMFTTIDARFEGIKREFELIEDRRKEQKIDTKTAVDAALLAAKEAVREQTAASEKSIAKSESSASEQSRQQNATFSASLKGVTDTVSDLKDRVIGLENVRIVSHEFRGERRLDVGAVVGIAGVLIALASVIAVIVMGAAR